MLRKAAVALCLIYATHASGAEKEAPLTWPEGYVVHSTSPDGQFGVLVAGHDLGVANGEGDFDNFLANIKTHQVLGQITDTDYFENQNHRGLHVTWAPDSTACVLIYDGRFGYGQILLLELTASGFSQTDVGKRIDKTLAAAVGDGTNSAWFYFGENKKLLARALTYTGNPKMEDEQTRHAWFTGAYDRRAKKWIATKATRTKVYETLLDAYQVELTEEVFVAPEGDHSKVPRDFEGVIVNSEEEKEQHLDEAMNTVYKGVRVVLPSAKFAKVKEDQIAWLKKRDATPAGQRSELIIARIKALQEFLWN